MVTITPELLADLRRKAEMATPGPWRTLANAGYVEGPGREHVASAWWMEQHKHDDNADFIAAANPAVVLALLDRIEALEGRASNREEIARRAFEAVWLDAKSAGKGWGGASPAQKVFWYKAAENIEAFVLHGTSPTSGTHTEASSVINAASGGHDA